METKPPTKILAPTDRLVENFPLEQLRQTILLTKGLITLFMAIEIQPKVDLTLPVTPKILLQPYRQLERSQIHPIIQTIVLQDAIEISKT